MADGGSSDCPCSNISIMQLFHELKQRYPSVPDQIVSKIIRENCHDKNACKEVLEKENRSYLQTYPGAVISGNTRGNTERKSLSSPCCKFKSSSEDFSTSKSSDETSSIENKNVENGFHFISRGGMYSGETITENPILEKYLTNENNKEWKHSVDESFALSRNGHCITHEKCYKENKISEKHEGEAFSEESDLKESSTRHYERTSLTSNSICDSSDIADNAHQGFDSGKGTDSTESKPKCVAHGRGQSFTKMECNGCLKGENYCDPRVRSPSGSQYVPIHNYQVAVQYSVNPRPASTDDKKRSFTTVNLEVCPPSTELGRLDPEARSGQRNLTYTSSVYDAKNGVRSDIQIVIGPGCGGATPTFRTYVSSPESQFSSFGSSCCSPQFSTGYRCRGHRIKALLEKQKEQKNRLARELRKEQDKLRHMQNEVKLMKASIAQKPSPNLLPKLKTEIERLRAECEKLTAAVDLYSDSQNILPLGETDEEFYRNIYTGQRLQREGSWSCQLCTFRNHPLLNVCEECEMPRISLGSPQVNVAPHLSNMLPNNNSSFCTEGETSTSGSLMTAPLQDSISRSCVYGCKDMVVDWKEPKK